MPWFPCPSCCEQGSGTGPNTPPGGLVGNCIPCPGMTTDPLWGLVTLDGGPCGCEEIEWHGYSFSLPYNPGLFAWQSPVIRQGCTHRGDFPVRYIQFELGTRAFPCNLSITQFFPGRGALSGTFTVELCSPFSFVCYTFNYDGHGGYTGNNSLAGVHYPLSGMRCHPFQVEFPLTLYGDSPSFPPAVPCPCSTRTGKLTITQ